MPAIPAFNSSSVKRFSKDEYLHLSEFQGTQDSAQPGNSIAVTLRLPHNLPHQLLPAVLLPVSQHPVRSFADVILRYRCIRRKVTQQTLLEIGMQVRFEFGPAGFMTTND
jgi:hypothetical protein